MNTVICACDQGFTCEEHTEANDVMTWPVALGIKPSPFDAWDAYEGGLKGKYWAGWDTIDY